MGDRMLYSVYEQLKTRLQPASDEDLRALVRDEATHPLRRQAALDLLAERYPRRARGERGA